MLPNLSSDDLAQIAALGISTEVLAKQIENFREGFPPIELAEPATIANGGITQLSDNDIARYTDLYDKQVATKGLDVLKFVPASGAATRMFKELFAFSSTYFGVSHNFEKEFPSVKEFLENIRSFAFWNDLDKKMQESGLDASEYLRRGDYTTVINYLLGERYLAYGSLPKALLKFHRYGHTTRTPIEEHIVEGAGYAASADGTVRLHFTVSPEHRQLFRQKINEVAARYEKEYHIKLKISYSEQRHYTDTIAVNERNELLRDEEGRLIFRPGGHGALIENLSDCNADIIFIKNIDNVVPDWLKHTTIVYKKALGGLLLQLREESHDYIRQIKSGVSAKKLQEIETFCRDSLHIDLPDPLPTSTMERRKLLLQMLNRPIRVCGMVKNQGEPGGGPFFVKDATGKKSLQIVESAQVNLRNPGQQEIFAQSTHFNPVDLVCSTKDFRGRRFNLRKYVDPSTGFISKKSKGATTLKSQELPGLWNGAMAFWNTVFVEVPLATFNPVKTVNDLLRKEHRS